MSTIEVEVRNAVGLHARPASLFVKLAASYPCAVLARNVTANSNRANAKSILSVMTLGVKQGDILEIQADGPQANEALEALARLVREDLAE